MTGNFGSMVTVHGGNEALLRYSFKELPKSHIIMSLPEASVCFSCIPSSFSKKKCYHSTIFIVAYEFTTSFITADGMMSFKPRGGVR